MNNQPVKHKHQWLHFILTMAGICALLSAGTALVVLTASALASPLIPPSQIAYMRSVNTAADVYVMDVNRSLTFNLTDTPANTVSARRALLYESENALVWSPNGTSIAYVAKVDTFSLNLVDLHRQLLTLIPAADLISGLTWLPDGTTLAYSGSQPISSRRDVYTYTLTDDSDFAAPLRTKPLVQTDDDDHQIAWSPDGSRYAYISGFALYVVDLADPNPTRLTTADVLPIMFNWSPDGSQIALAANQIMAAVNYTDLYLVNPTTGETTALGIRNPSGTLQDVVWSPDGRKLAFVSNHLENRLALYVWNIHDLYPRLLTDRTFASVAEPDWAPDSDTLVFVGFTALRLTDLYLIDSSGSDLRRLPGTPGYVWAPRCVPGVKLMLRWLLPGWMLLTVGVGTVLLVLTLAVSPLLPVEEVTYISGQFVGAAYYPDIYRLDVRHRLSGNLTWDRRANFKVDLTWSPDGKTLAYTMINPNDIQAIYLYDMPTHTAQRLTLPDAQSMSYPHWSPDGTTLSFSVYDRVKSVWQLYLADLRQTPIAYTQLLDQLAIPPDARWSPDGSRLVYMMLGGGYGGMHLEVLTLATGESRAVTASYGLFSPGNWSPDGQSLVFRGANRDGRVGVFVVSLSTGEEHWLNNDYRYEPPVWSHDGQQVAWHGDDNGIYLQAVSADSPRRLFRGAGLDTTPPDWSPDGTRLLFSQRHQLALIHLPSGSIEVLTDGDQAKSLYAWRPGRG